MIPDFNKSSCIKWLWIAGPLVAVTFCFSFSFCSRDTNTRHIFFREDPVTGAKFFFNEKIGLSVDQDTRIRTFFIHGNDTMTLNPEIPEGFSSHFLLVDSVVKDHFRMTDFLLEDIDNEFGKGKNFRSVSVDRSHEVEKVLDISMYEKLPDLAVIQAKYKNISIGMMDVSEAHSCLLRLDEKLLNSDTLSGFWTFQGASYEWGQDFVFPLPKAFVRENFMGLNDIKTGGGIPLVDLWCKKMGIALGALEPRPTQLSLPVGVNKDQTVDLSVVTKPGIILGPGEDFTDVRTIIIVHELDFFNALKSYSAAIQKIIPQFKDPPEIAYQPEWCTWGYGPDFSVEQVRKMIPTLKGQGFKSVILDSGWFPVHGDWSPDPEKFPLGEEDFKNLIHILHKNGFKVWLWWLPHYAVRGSEILATHPDWFVKNEQGAIDESYALCTSYGPVKEYLAGLVKKFVKEWDVDGLKLDWQQINSAPFCFDPDHGHQYPSENFISTPDLFRMIYTIADSLKPGFLVEYCACSLPPTIYHLPWCNIAVTSDPNIGQITRRIKMYKAILGPDFPVLEEWCGVLAGPSYELAIGAGGVPGTFSTRLDEHSKNRISVYRDHMLSKGEYLNLYDIGFDFPETHVIRKSDTLFYALYTHPWSDTTSHSGDKSSGLYIPGHNYCRIPFIYRFGTYFDHDVEDNREEFNYPPESYSGMIQLRGLDPGKRYRIFDYVNKKNLGSVQGSDPELIVEFDDYLMLKTYPE